MMTNCRGRSQVEAVDPDEGDNGRVAYKISYSPQNGSETFGVKPDTGEVFVNETPLHPGTYTIIVNASDQPADPAEMKYALAVVTITINTEGTYAVRVAWRSAMSCSYFVAT